MIVINHGASRINKYAKERIDKIRVGYNAVNLTVDVNRGRASMFVMSRILLIVVAILFATNFSAMAQPQNFDTPCPQADQNGSWNGPMVYNFTGTGIGGGYQLPNIHFCYRCFEKDGVCTVEIYISGLDFPTANYNWVDGGTSIGWWLETSRGMLDAAFIGRTAPFNGMVCAECLFNQIPDCEEAELTGNYQTLIEFRNGSCLGNIPGTDYWTSCPGSPECKTIYKYCKNPDYVTYPKDMTVLKETIPVIGNCDATCYLYDKNGNPIGIITNIQTVCE